VKLNNQIEKSGEDLVEADFFIAYLKSISVLLEASVVCDNLVIRFNGLTFENPIADE
jgi:hypothetical protein